MTIIPGLGHKQASNEAGHPYALGVNGSTKGQAIPLPKDMMDKPISIFVCGVQKGGTTSLHAHFAEHRALLPPYRKETHFFDDEHRNWSNPDYAALTASFPSNESNRKPFDITPIYGFWPPSIARIQAYNPKACLIFLFRDPFERAWSHWRMQTARGLESLPFAEAIRQGRSRLNPDFPLSREWRAFSYMERALYGRQVERALAHFPRRNLLFLRSDDLKNDHRTTLARIAEFLDIAPFPETGPKRENMGSGVSPPSVPSDDDRRLVADVLREDLRTFVALTGLDIADWPTAPATDHAILLSSGVATLR